MPTFKLEGFTYENSVAAQNIVIAYKADRNDPASIGQELDRVTANADGSFLLTFDDWDEDIFVLAVDPTTGTTYETVIVDWLRPQLQDYDPYFDYVVSLARMDGANNGVSFPDETGKVSYSPEGSTVTSTDQVKFGATAAKFIRADEDSALVGAHSGNLDLGSNNFCLEFFLYCNSVTGGHHTLMTNRSLTDANNYSYHVSIYNGTLQYWFSTDLDGVQSRSAAGIVTADAWHHIAIVRNGQTVKAYIDGIENNSITVSKYSIAEQSPGPIRFGHDNHNLGRVLDGYIDSFRATVGHPRYTQNFTPPTLDYPTDKDRYFHKVAALLHMDGTNGESTFTDQKGNAVSAIGSAVTSNTQFKWGITSFYNPNSTSRLVIANSPSLSLGSQDFTIEAWVWCNNDGQHKTIANKRANNLVHGEFVFWVSSNEGLHFYLYNGTTWDSCLSVDGVVPTGQWVHLAATRRGTALRSFVNGVEVASLQTAADVPADSNPIHLGSEANNTNYLTGYIDDFRLTIGVARYTSDFAPPNRAFQDI